MSSSPSHPDMEQDLQDSAINNFLRRKRGGAASLTLGELFKRLGDATSPSPSHHHLLDLPSSSSSSSAIVVPDDEPVVLHNPKSLPFVLTFIDLTYSIRQPKRLLPFSALRDTTGPSHQLLPTTHKPVLTKTLLDSISGEAREGEILAVLGASGSGKSTLIDALANRIARESLKGSITLNGERLESRLLKVISAYVMQDDLLYPMLTVEETLTFSAEFRLPRSLPAAKKRERVQALIDQLGLRNAARTIIGDEGHRGVSGGERRRVSIGIDIIHDPIILFLDEPTSGLDSTSAFMVVKVLQRIAQSGSVVVMSIHQPSSRILGLLDRLLFLSRGQTVYSGTAGGLAPYFAEFGQPIPENENRTEFALDLIRELELSPSGTTALVNFHRQYQLRNSKPTTIASDSHYERFSLKDAISASISRGKLVSGATTDGAVSGSSVAATTTSKGMPTFANPMWTEMWVLTKRSFTNSRRLPELFAIRLGVVMVTGFLLATVFWRLDPSPKGVQERLGFFAFAMSTTFYTTAEALPVFLQDRYIFMRETNYNAYRRSSYVLSNALVSLPTLVLLAAAFATTTFFPVGLAGGAHGFLIYFLTILAAFWAGNSFVTFLSGIVTHVMLGFTVVVAINAYFFLFSGFLISRDRIPSYWIWFHYSSLVKYPYQAVLQNEFGDPNRCFVRGVQLFDGSPLGALTAGMKEQMLQGMSTMLGMNINNTTCLTTGPNILRQQGVTDLGKWECIFVTVAWGFFFRGLFYIMLMLGSKNKRR